MPQCDERGALEECVALTFLSTKFSLNLKISYQINNSNNIKSEDPDDLKSHLERSIIVHLIKKEAASRVIFKYFRHFITTCFYFKLQKVHNEKHSLDLVLI